LCLDTGNLRLEPPTGQEALDHRIREFIYKDQRHVIGNGQVAGQEILQCVGQDRIGDGQFVENVEGAEGGHGQFVFNTRNVCIEARLHRFGAACRQAIGLQETAEHAAQQAELVVFVEAVAVVVHVEQLRRPAQEALGDEQFGLPPERYVAIGYGEHHPRDTNATPAGRARNRRVDILFSWDPWQIKSTPQPTSSSLLQNLEPTE